MRMLPYWEGVEVERTVENSMERVAILEGTFPGKPIVVAEVRWPSNGRTRESAVASKTNEALFLRRFLALAKARGYTYYSGQEVQPACSARLAWFV